MSSEILFQLPNIDRERLLKLSGEEILDHLSQLDCLDEVLELVDLEKRKDATLYSIEYQIAVRQFVENYNFDKIKDKEFDSFLMHLVLTASTIRNGSRKFHINLNRICLNLINGIYEFNDIPMQLQCAMFHLQMVAGDNSFVLYRQAGKEFYLGKARQHFIMAVNFVQNISVAKAFEAQCRVSDVSTEMVMNDVNNETVEQSIVDTHNAVEFGKFIDHSYTHELKVRYADLCDILSDIRPNDREYWQTYCQELKQEAAEALAL